MAAQPLSAGFFADMVVPRLILLDRDGVVNQDVGAPGIICPSQLQLTPNAGIAIGRLKRSGCKIALITNQSCVGKGLINIQQLNVIHQRIQDMVRLIYLRFRIIACISRHSHFQLGMRHFKAV